MKNILILITGILLLTTGSHGQTLLSPDDFQKKISTAQGQILDVRTPQEFSQGHLTKAVNIDYKNPAFREQIKSLDKNKPVLVYCLGGVRSASAAKILHENGFREVYDMQGGYMKWTAAGKLIDAPAGTTESKGMNATDYKKLIQSNSVVLIDFYAPWCEPCVKMMPVVNKLAAEYKSRAKVETISYDTNKALAKTLGIEEIPAFFLYKNGKLVEKRNGFQTEAELRSLIDITR